MLTKLYDAAVKTDEYQDRQGQTKGKWTNVGSVMRGDDGKMFLLLDRTFNPAGVRNPENRGNVLVSFFDPKAPEQQQEQRQEQRAAQGHARQNDMDDEIPF